MISLEKLEDSYDNERAKIRTIRSIPANVMKTCCLSGVTWIVFVAVRVLLSQFHQKFTVLWEPTLQSLSHLFQELDSSAAENAKYVEVDDFSTCDRVNNSHSKKRSSSALYGSSETTERTPKRRRVRPSVGLIRADPLYQWVWAELQRELYMTCHSVPSVTAQDGQSPPTSRQSVKYQRTKRAKGRYPHLRTLDELPARSKRFDEGNDSMRGGEFWKSYLLTGCNGSTIVVDACDIRQADCFSRHQQYCKVLGKLSELWLSKTDQLVSSTQDPDSWTPRQCVGWIIKWALASSLALCDRMDDANDIDITDDSKQRHHNSALLVAMTKLISRSRRGRESRMGDSVRVVLCIKNIETLGIQQETEHHETVLDPLLSDWNRFLDISLHRVLLRPNRDLQNLCLQVAVVSNIIVTSA